VTLVKGAIVQLALTPGAATEIATNDSNSYTPGASNDTVWNTFINPRSNTAQGSSIHRGGIFGVVLDASVADNEVGEVGFYGVYDAYCIKSGTDNMAPGDPLTIAVTATNCTLDGVINSNEIVVATYEDNQTNLTNRRLRNVFFHNGLFTQGPGSRTAAATAFS